MNTGKLIKTLRSNAEATQKENTTMHDKVASMVDELSIYRESNKTLKADNGLILQSLKDLKTRQAEDLKRIEDEYENGITNAQWEVAAKEKEYRANLANVRKQVKGLNGKNQSLTDQLTQVKELLTDKKTYANMVTAERTDLLKKYTSLDFANDKLKSHIKELEHSADTNARIGLTLHDDLAQLRVDLKKETHKAVISHSQTMDAIMECNRLNTNRLFYKVTMWVFVTLFLIVSATLEVVR